MNQTFELDIRFKLQGNFLKIACETEIEFRNIVDWMKSNGVQFKTYNLKEEHPIKIVIRDLPTSTPKEAITASIEATGFRVINTYQLKRRGTKKNLPLFYLQIHPVDNIWDIYTIHNIMST